jgi:hypothetical protein
MRADITNERDLIPANADFKAVAKDIVNNIESWRADSQAKTDLAFAKIMSNTRANDAERAKSLAERSNKTIEGNRGYGEGRRMGD